MVVQCGQECGPSQQLLMVLVPRGRRPHPQLTTRDVECVLVLTGTECPRCEREVVVKYGGLESRRGGSGFMEECVTLSRIVSSLLTTLPVVMHYNYGEITFDRSSLEQN